MLIIIGIAEILEKLKINSDKFFNYTGLFVMISTAILFVCGVVMSIKVSTTEELSRVEKSYNIYSLRNEDGISGTFFLGSGSIENEIYYVVLAKNKHGYYQEIIKGTVYFVESDEETPRVEKIDYYKYGVNESMLFNFSWVQRKHYVIYVPKNTLIIDYRID